MALLTPDVFYWLTQPLITNFVLPFLLLFAMIFGVLSSTNMLGKNKGVHAIIALVVAILSLRYGVVQAFFSNIFPRLGVGLAVILSLIILIGFLVPQKHREKVSIAFVALASLIGLVVVFNAFSALNWFNSQWWYNWGSTLVVGLIIAGLIAAVVVSSRNEGGGGSGGSSS